MNVSEVKGGVPAIPWFLRSVPRLLATTLVVLGLPLGLFTVGVVREARATLESQAVDQNTIAARLGAEAVRAHFEGLIGYVESYARRPELGSVLVSASVDGVRAHLRDLVEGATRLDRAFLTDPAGIELYDWPPDPTVIGKSFAFRDWYRGVTASGHTYVSEVYRRAAAPRHLLVAIATPVRSGSGEVLGLLVAQHTVEALQREIAGIAPAEGARITLVDHRGHLVAEGEGPDSDPSDLGAHPLIRGMLERGEASTSGADPRTGEPSLFSHASSGTIGWIVVAQQAEAAVHAPAVALQNGILGMSFLCLVGMTGLGFLCLSTIRTQHLAVIELQEHKDFLSGMIFHDLRSPLASTILSLDLVRAGSREMSPQARQDVERAALSARRMNEIVETLLDVMRLENGVLELRLERRELGELVRARVEEHQVRARSRGVELRAEGSERTVEALVDPGLFTRVLDNLITNAIKHTRPGGRVDVGIGAGGEDPQVGCTLEVADTGEGIAAEDLPRLFQKYGRASGQSLGSASDIGLGLVFCRMAVELHGGRIEVESALQRGSTFRVCLPPAGPGSFTPAKVARRVPPRVRP